ncbi:similar to Saccharomyces cerevisiae YKR041W Protein of unknown function [Maudiozyma saulgeensis]|uniref:Uncharacterized protein n=1 Tax=Maudiozyma saulgeensis TaxID=1789683 RepID=A0A1X7R0X2_9SACH|nr:similar to Saccharomyces cerevisiae YKR041W Protein of unknown function [Kazachstania saulgeensis]
MAISDDSDEEEEYSDYLSSDLLEDHQYHQINILKEDKRKRESHVEKGPKNSSKTSNEAEELIKSRPIDPKLDITQKGKKYRLRYVNSMSSNKVELNSIKINESMMSKKKKKGKQYYEVGDPVSGYKFISSEPPPNKKQKKKENIVEPEIDRFQFDRNTNNGMKTRSASNLNHNVNESLLIHKYWSKTTGNNISLPIMSNKNGTLNLLTMEDCEEDIESIAKEKVLQFYLKSQKIMNYNMIQLLKQERTRWHPDKLIKTNTSTSNYSNNVLLATRLFQIINELWESYH